MPACSRLRLGTAWYASTWSTENLPAFGPAIAGGEPCLVLRLRVADVALPRSVSVLGKAEYTDRRITKWLFCGAGMIPIRRENPADLVRMPRKSVIYSIAERWSVCSPRERDHEDGLLHRGHSGAAHLALTTDVPGSFPSASSAPTGSCRPAPGWCARSGTPRSAW